MLKINPITFRRAHLSKVVTSQGTFVFNPPVQFAATRDVTDTAAALSLLRQVFHLAYKEAQRKQKLFNYSRSVYSDQNYSRVRDWFEGVLLDLLKPVFSSPSTIMDDEQTEYTIAALQSRYSDIANLVADILLTHASFFITWSNDNAKRKVPEAEPEVKGRNKAVLSLKVKTFFGENYSFEAIATAPEGEKSLNNFSFCVPLAVSEIFQKFYSAWCTAASGCDYDEKMRITYFRQAQHVKLLTQYLDDLFTGKKSASDTATFSLDVIDLEIPRHISNSDMDRMENNIRVSFEYKNKKTAIQMIGDFMRHAGTLHPAGIAY